MIVVWTDVEVKCLKSLKSYNANEIIHVESNQDNDDLGASQSIVNRNIF